MSVTVSTGVNGGISSSSGIRSLRSNLLCFTVNAPGQAAEITFSVWLAQPLRIPPGPAGHGIREHSGQRRDGKGQVKPVAGGDAGPAVEVSRGHLGSPPGIARVHARQMLAQVLESEEGMANIGLRPVEKNTAIKKIGRASC